MEHILLVLCPLVWHKLPPIGLAYISEYLKSIGYNVDVIDLNIENISILDKISGYDCIGLSVFKTNQYNTLVLVKEIKKKNPKIKIILGGPQCFSWQFETPPDDVRYADIMIVGDALPPLDERPFPAFNGFKLDRYQRKMTLPIISSRGCRRFFKKCKSVGLHFEISLIVNYPGEEEREFTETLNFIRENVQYIPKIAQINPFIKYPGTIPEQTPINEGLKKVERVIKVVEELGIKYTPGFINNLVYER